MSSLSFDAVLCDIDGVLRLWDPDGMPGLDRAYGLPAGTLAAAAFRPERLLPAITGVVTDEEWRSDIAEDLVAVCGSPDRARALVAEWQTLTGRVDEEVLELLTTARRHSRRAGLQRHHPAGSRPRPRLGLADGVDAVVNTARIGVAKPDARVYRIAADLSGVPSPRCLFIDDTLANVTAASSAGMIGLHYQRVQQLRDVLSSLIGTEPAR